MWRALATDKLRPISAIIGIEFQFLQLANVTWVRESVVTSGLTQVELHEVFQLLK